MRTPDTAKERQMGQDTCAAAQSDRLLTSQLFSQVFDTTTVEVRSKGSENVQRNSSRKGNSEDTGGYL